MHRKKIGGGMSCTTQPRARPRSATQRRAEHRTHVLAHAPSSSRSSAAESTHAMRSLPTHAHTRQPTAAGEELRAVLATARMHPYRKNKGRIHARARAKELVNALASSRAKAFPPMRHLRCAMAQTGASRTNILHTVWMDQSQYHHPAASAARPRCRCPVSPSHTAERCTVGAACLCRKLIPAPHGSTAAAYIYKMVRWICSPRRPPLMLTKLHTCARAQKIPAEKVNRAVFLLHTFRSRQSKVEKA